jgi:hypothetical protein
MITVKVISHSKCIMQQCCANKHHGVIETKNLSIEIKQHYVESECQVHMCASNGDNVHEIILLFFETAQLKYTMQYLSNDSVDEKHRDVERWIDVGHTLKYDVNLTGKERRDVVQRAHCHNSTGIKCIR